MRGHLFLQMLKNEGIGGLEGVLAVPKKHNFNFIRSYQCPACLEIVFEKTVFCVSEFHIDLDSTVKHVT